MKCPTWNTRKDPEYRRVRGLILRFLTRATRRAYIDGRLTEDQKDDVQDGFEVYLTKVRGKTNNREEVVLYHAIRTLIDTKKKASRISVGGEEVEREFITIRNG